MPLPGLLRWSPLACHASRRWPCWARAPWAPRSPRILPTPACRPCCSTSTQRPRATGLDRARKLKPDPLFGPDALALIRTGGFDADLERAKDADWILEAVVERLDVKRELLARVDAVRRPGSIVSSNTSGIPIAALAEGRSDDFRRHWLGTHFFNPPRYLRLLEIIPTPETDPAVIDAVSCVCRPSARKRRGRREGHAELHRQPHRALRRHPDDRRAVRRRLQRRGDRRDHGAGPWASQERDLQDDGHRRPRRAGPGGSQPVRSAARGRARGLRGAAASGAPDRQGLDRREGRAGFLQTGKERGRRVRDSRAGPGDLGVPPRAAGEARCAGSLQVHRRHP